MGDIVLPYKAVVFFFFFFPSNVVYSQSSLFHSYKEDNITMLTQSSFKSVLHKEAIQDTAWFNFELPAN